MKMRCNKYSATDKGCKFCAVGKIHEKNSGCDIRGCGARPAAKNAICKPVEEGKRS